MKENSIVVNIIHTMPIRHFAATKKITFIQTRMMENYYAQINIFLPTISSFSILTFYSYVQLLGKWIGCE
jgi:hypothetical protein